MRKAETFAFMVLALFAAFASVLVFVLADGPNEVTGPMIVIGAALAIGAGLLWSLGS